MTPGRRVLGCFLFSVLIASAVWFSREWQYQAGVHALGYIFAPVIMLAIVVSPNVHDPSGVLVWLAITLQAFAMALLATGTFSALRRKRNRRTS